MKHWLTLSCLIMVGTKGEVKWENGEMYSRNTSVVALLI